MPASKRQQEGAGATSLAAQPPLIDAHAHIWGPSMPLIRSAWARPDYVFPVETYLDLLDSNGVAYGVIAAASLFGTFNDYVIRALRAHKRLRGTVIVDPEIGFYELEAMRRDGVVGARLQLFHVDPLPDFASDAYTRLFHRLRDLGMHVHVNVEPARLAPILAVLERTGVRIVIDHFGWPDAALGLACPAFRASVAACQRGHAWVKLSGGYRYADPAFPRMLARAYVEQVGTDRLFWGSDAPFVGCEGAVDYAETLAQFAFWLPDPAVRAAIFRTSHAFYFGDRA